MSFPITVTYRDTKEFKPEQLAELFLSVDWSSGYYADKLAAAMKNYGTVFSAWEGDKLVGLIAALDDGVMTAYIHYLLVMPEYQRRGIGRALLHLATEHYKDYLRILLVAYGNETDFYKRCGFTVGEGKTSMYITTLWT